ncbi:MAG TPA: DUF4388 domain-containing protein, partial [Vicinamibacteria bacterium]|nr:DUF4388 domain-containing protein [Vicinamibacteria bacterium]
MSNLDDGDLREALSEIQQYLSDRLAPLMVTDSMLYLLTQPPEAMISAIRDWLLAQVDETRPNVTLSDYLFHAVRKIHLLGELDLVGREALGSYLEQLGQQLVMDCPEEDRELLCSNLARLGQSESGVVARVETLHRQPGAPGATGPVAATGGPMSPAAERGLRRLEVLLERLSRHGVSASSTADGNKEPGRRELLSQAIATAAASSSNARELDHRLDLLKKMGISADNEKVFELLAGSLPGWNVEADRSSEGPQKRPALSYSAEAMYRFVKMARDSAESGKRFQELVYAAVRQFNGGMLSRSATMFGLATWIAEEKYLSPAVIDAIQTSAHGHLDEERLRKFAESPDKHLLLRRVLGFFSRFSPESLLDDLWAEERRDRRRLKLALLQVQAERARSACLERLETELAGDSTANPYFIRNLIYLLRVIPRPEGEPVETEIDLIVRASGRDSSLTLIKEAITYLGETKHTKAGAVLTGYLKSYEELLLSGAAPASDRLQLCGLLDRLAASLARLGTRNATTALIEHGLNRQPGLGITSARLVGLGTRDLSSHSEDVNRILEALRSELPGKLLSRFVKTREDALVHYIAALSGTPSVGVTDALTDVAKRFPKTKFGEAAARTLLSFHDASSRSTTGAAMTGDLEFFGLPHILQTLERASATGVLTLFYTNETVAAVIRMQNGKYKNCETERLKNEEAVYELFEKPFPGKFAFVDQGRVDDPDVNDPDPTLVDVVSLIM